MSDDTTNARDRLVEIRVQGMRALADVRLPLGGLTVLIGDNGTGKSSLVEAFELLRAAARPGPLPGSFLRDQILAGHGGLGALLRVGSPALAISARIAGPGGEAEYRVALAPRGSDVAIAEEHLDVWEGGASGSPRSIIARDLSGCRVLTARETEMTPVNVPPGTLALTFAGYFAHAAVQRMIDVFANGAVHVPLRVDPLWVARERNPLRSAGQVTQTAGLDRLGGNLANCFHELRNGSDRAAWERVMERVRAGIGLDVVDVAAPAAGRGEIELTVQFRSLMKPIPAASLSDGQLSYLAFVALAELGKSQSFLVFDEPESHLHPELLVRVVWLLEELARSCPVIVSTHSDRLLDALSEPERSVFLCELDEQRATRLLRPDHEELAKWLTRYRGLGDLRAAGYGAHVVTKPVGTSR
jgi:predicted ATPase